MALIYHRLLIFLSIFLVGIVQVNAQAQDSAEATLRYGGASHTVRSVSDISFNDFDISVGTDKAYDLTGDESNVISKNDYFYLKGYGLFRYEGADKSSSDSTSIKFQDKKTGETIESTYTLSCDIPKAETTLNIGGKTYKVISSSDITQNDFSIKVDISGDGIIGNYDRPIVSDESSQISKSAYFYLSDYGLIQYKSADRLTASNPVIKFMDVSAGNTIERPLSDICTAGDVSATLKIGGSSYTITSASDTSSNDFDINVDLDGGGTSATITSQTGMDFVYSGSTQLNAHFNDASGNRAVVPVAYSSSSIKLGDNDDDLILDESQTISKNDYFVVTAGGKSYALRYKGADKLSSYNPIISFQNVGSGETIESNLSSGAGSIASIIIGGNSFDVYSASATTSNEFDIKVDLNDDGKLDGTINIFSSNEKRKFKYSSLSQFMHLFIDGNNNEASIPIAYSSSGIKPGDNDDDLVLDQTKTVTRNDYFVLGADNQWNYALRYTGADKSTSSSPIIKFQNLGTGETIEISYQGCSDTGAKATLNLGGKAYLVKSAKYPVDPSSFSDFNINADLNGDGTMGNYAKNIIGSEFISIKKNDYVYLDSYGLVMYKGADKSTSDSPVIKFQDVSTGKTIERPYPACTDSTASTDLKIAGRTYEVVSVSDVSANDFDIKVDMNGNGAIGDYDIDIVKNSGSSISKNEYFILWGATYPLFIYKGADKSTSDDPVIKFQDVELGDTIEISYRVVSDEKEEENEVTEPSIPTITEEPQCPNGCLLDNTCIPFGVRNENRYCDFDKTLKPQKSIDENCQNNYECLTNQCSSNKCIDIEKELRETKGLLQKILDWIANLFRFG